MREYGMDLWMDLERFYNEWKKAKENADFSEFYFYPSNENNRFFLYKTKEYSEDRSLEWFIEIQEKENDTYKILDNTFSPCEDDACLLVQICWCLEKIW